MIITERPCKICTIISTCIISVRIDLAWLVTGYLTNGDFFFSCTRQSESRRSQGVSTCQWCQNLHQLLGPLLSTARWQHSSGHQMLLGGERQGSSLMCVSLVIISNQPYNCLPRFCRLQVSPKTYFSVWEVIKFDIFPFLVSMMGEWIEGKGNTAWQAINNVCHHFYFSDGENESFMDWVIFLKIVKPVSGRSVHYTQEEIQYYFSRSRHYKRLTTCKRATIFSHFSQSLNN